MEKNEEEKIVKAKRQLLLTGVVCVTVVVITLWAVNLRASLARNRARYAPVPKNTWKQLQEQIHTLWPKN